MTIRDGALPGQDATEPIYKFHLRGQYSTKNNHLVGMRLAQWWKVVVGHWRDIDWRHYWFRVLFLFIMACVNTVLTGLEYVFHGHRTSDVVINKRPVFLLGHNRSGTTLLHNLFSLNTDQFRVPTTFSVGFSAIYFLLYPIRRVMNSIVDPSRPMDNLPLSMDVPQEDELAYNQSTPLLSPYANNIFPREADHYHKYFRMIDVPAEERARYMELFRAMVKQLSVHAEGRRLCFKSPPHTAKVKLLLEEFPDAQFVFIHRNPYRVFRSMLHLADNLWGHSTLQTASDARLLETILTMYEVVHDAYLEDRKLIPKGNLVEISFDELQRDKIATMRRIYESLKIGGFEKSALPALEAHVKEIKNYKKNAFVGLTDAQRRIVNTRWARFFTAFGYKMQTEAGDVHISMA
ncbi:hypothetical protein PTSG_10621 [Salpingoeca rosetta]|uniref:Sulfotransferase n=1 Tax=Salpingoeca rosetta (strain ATCC 50818 / BSB-021) TaxID=946362 RepID=F2URW1_SALR5|nr:uncharacterized protein PTSG_10621 [Salpingoeca rosetta]EGD80366.1 hypothetical protein PTSG_10621 [Salpingoeca rosetta]|eukprot:XP_004988156.1 hypothetical protein PTSG_10621 [Salpingoeca rosetta]